MRYCPLQIFQCARLLPQEAFVKVARRHWKDVDRLVVVCGFLRVATNNAAEQKPTTWNKRVITQENAARSKFGPANASRSVGPSVRPSVRLYNTTEHKRTPDALLLWPMSTIDTYLEMESHSPPPPSPGSLKRSAVSIPGFLCTCMKKKKDKETWNKTQGQNRKMTESHTETKRLQMNSWIKCEVSYSGHAGLDLRIMLSSDKDVHGDISWDWSQADSPWL